MLTAKRERRADLQNIAVDASRSNQHAPLPHRIDEPVGQDGVRRFGLVTRHAFDADIESHATHIADQFDIPAQRRDAVAKKVPRLLRVLLQTF